MEDEVKKDIQDTVSESPVYEDAIKTDAANKIIASNIVSDDKQLKEIAAKNVEDIYNASVGTYGGRASNMDAALQYAKDLDAFTASRQTHPTVENRDYGPADRRIRTTGYVTTEGLQDVKQYTYPIDSSEGTPVGGVQPGTTATGMYGSGTTGVSAPEASLNPMSNDQVKNFYWKDYVPRVYQTVDPFEVHSNYLPDFKIKSTTTDPKQLAWKVSVDSLGNNPADFFGHDRVGLTELTYKKPSPTWLQTIGGGVIDAITFPIRVPVATIGAVTEYGLKAMDADPSLINEVRNYTTNALMPATPMGVDDGLWKRTINQLPTIGAQLASIYFMGLPAAVVNVLANTAMSTASLANDIYDMPLSTQEKVSRIATRAGTSAVLNTIGMATIYPTLLGRSSINLLTKKGITKASLKSFAANEAIGEGAVATDIWLDYYLRDMDTTQNADAFNDAIGMASVVNTIATMVGNGLSYKQLNEIRQAGQKVMLDIHANIIKGLKDAEATIQKIYGVDAEGAKKIIQMLEDGYTNGEYSAELKAMLDAQMSKLQPESVNAFIKQFEGATPEQAKEIGRYLRTQFVKDVMPKIGEGFSNSERMAIVGLMKGIASIMTYAGVDPRSVAGEMFSVKRAKPGEGSSYVPKERTVYVAQDVGSIGLEVGMLTDTAAKSNLTPQSRSLLHEIGHGLDHMLSRADSELNGKPENTEPGLFAEWMPKYFDAIKTAFGPKVSEKVEALATNDRVGSSSALTKKMGKRARKRGANKDVQLADTPEATSEYFAYALSHLTREQLFDLLGLTGAPAEVMDALVAMSTSDIVIPEMQKQLNAYKQSLVNTMKQNKTLIDQVLKEYNGDTSELKAAVEKFVAGDTDALSLDNLQKLADIVESFIDGETAEVVGEVFENISIKTFSEQAREEINAGLEEASPEQNETVEALNRRLRDGGEVSVADAESSKTDGAPKVIDKDLQKTLDDMEPTKESGKDIFDLSEKDESSDETLHELSYDEEGKLQEYGYVATRTPIEGEGLNWRKYRRTGEGGNRWFEGNYALADKRLDDKYYDLFNAPYRKLGVDEKALADEQLLHFNESWNSDKNKRLIPVIEELNNKGYFGDSLYDFENVDGTLELEDVKVSFVLDSLISTQGTHAFALLGRKGIWGFKTNDSVYVFEGTPAAQYKVKIPPRETLIDLSERMGSRVNKQWVPLMEKFDKEGRFGFSLTKYKNKETGRLDLDNVGAYELIDKLQHHIQREPFESEDSVMVSNLLSENGVKGFTYVGKRDGRGFVIFETEDIPVVERLREVSRDPDAALLASLYAKLDGKRVDTTLAHKLEDKLDGKTLIESQDDVIDAISNAPKGSKLYTDFTLGKYTGSVMDVLHAVNPALEKMFPVGRVSSARNQISNEYMRGWEAKAKEIVGGDNEYRKWTIDSQLKRYKTTKNLIGGKTVEVELSKQQLMSAYELLKQSDAGSNARIVKSYPEIKSLIDKNLTSQDKAVADMTQQHLQGIFDRIKDILSDEDNIDLGKIENYFPIYDVIKTDTGTRINSAKARSVTNGRYAGGIEAQPIFEVLQRYVEWAANVESGYTRTLRRMKDVFNYKSDGMYKEQKYADLDAQAENNAFNIRQALRERYGENMVEKINSEVSDLLDQHPVYTPTGAFASATNTLISNAISWNILSLPKNLLSNMFIGMTEPGAFASFLKGLMAPRATYEDMIRYSAISDRLAGVDIDDLLNTATRSQGVLGYVMNNTKLGSFLVGKGYEKPVTALMAYSSLFKKLGQKTFMQFGDALGLVYGLKPTVDKMRAQGFNDAQINAELTRKIQEFTSTADKATEPKAIRDIKRTGVGPMLAFKKDLAIKAAKIARDLVDAYRGDSVAKQAAARDIAAIILSIGVFSAISAGVWDLWSDDEDVRKDAETAIKREVLSTMLGYNPMVSAMGEPVAEYALGFGGTSGYSSPILSFGNNYIKDLKKDRKFNIAIDTATLVAGMPGLPKAASESQGLVSAIFGDYVDERERDYYTSMALGRTENYASKRSGYDPKQVDKTDEND